MTPANSVQLPNEAVRAILAFMSRKQLIAFSGLNRQLVYIIQSPPFTVKPLLRKRWLDIRPASCDLCNSRECGHKGTTEVDLYFYVNHLWGWTHGRRGVELDPVLYSKWLRFNELYMRLPRNYHAGRKWLETLCINSNCLCGCEYLYVNDRDAVLRTHEDVELIEKFKPLVKRIIVHSIDH